MNGNTTIKRIYILFLAILWPLLLLVGMAIGYAIGGVNGLNFGLLISANLVLINFGVGLYLEHRGIM